MTIFRPAKTKIECQQAFELAKRVFLNDTSSTDAELKALSWSLYGNDHPDHLIIAIDDNNIIGAARIFPKVMTWRDQSFDVAGLTSICITPDRQGQGLGRQLMDTTNVQCDVLGFDFTYLVARRKADHFYPNFGFIGASSYQTVTALNLPLVANNLKLTPYSVNHAETYSNFYHKNYKDCFGATKRDAGFWQSAIQRIERSNFKFIEVQDNNQPIGYIINNGQSIVECAFENSINSASLKTALRLGFEKADVVMSIPHHHSMVDKLQDLDITFSSRKCLYGGHMLRWSPSSTKTPLIFNIGASSLNHEAPYFNLGWLDEV